MAITIPVLPIDNTQICLTIPNSSDYRQIVMGALQIMCQWWYWDVDNPSDAEEIVQRMMECWVITGNDYEGCMQIDCQDIIDCINDPNSGVSDAIANILNNQNSDTLRNSGQIENNINQASNNPTCDNDILWGQIDQLVDYFHQVNLDILEIIEVLTNRYEMLANIVGSVTGLDEISADALLQWIVSIQDNIAENYLAQVTVTYLDELKCALFCIASQSGCEITPDMLFTLFTDRFTSGLSINGLINDTISYLVAGVWVGDEIADFMFYSQIALRSQIGRVIGNYAYTDVNLRLGLYANDPSNDWVLLCGVCDCLPVTETYDFTVNDGSPIWYARPSQAHQMHWDAGVGWVGNNPGGSQLITQRFSTVDSVIVTWSITPNISGRTALYDFTVAYIGDSPFTGHYVMVGNELLLECRDPSGGVFEAIIESVEITGCLV